LALKASTLLVLIAAPAAAGNDHTGTSVREAGGVYTVTARFTVPQPIEAAIEVLTDYEGIPSFLPDVKRSTVRERAADHVVVDQEAVARALFFSRRIVLRLEVRRHGDTLTFRDRAGHSFAAYDGAWRLERDGDRTVVTYELSARPAFAVPGLVLRRALERDAQEMIARIRGEIARRDRAAARSTQRVG
jgi:carbon monoxide dehydrogenase subunit G